MKRVNLLIGLLSVLVVFAVAAAFKVAYNVVIPLMIAWLLSYICGPAVNYLVHRKIPLGVAVFAVLLLVMIVFYFCGTFLGGRVRNVLAVSPKYVGQFSDIYSDTINKLHLSKEYVAGIDWPQKLGPKLTQLTASTALWMGNFLGKLMLVLIFLVFMLLGKPYFRYKVERAFPPDRATKFTQITASISKQIGQYLIVKVAISGTTGLLVWLGFTLPQVEFALTWGAGLYRCGAAVDSDDDGQRDRTEDHGRPPESQSGGHPAFAGVLWLDVGNCRGAAVGADRGRHQDLLRKH